MKRKFLTDLGLEGEQVDAIMKEHGTSVNALKDELDNVEGYKTQIEELQEQIKDRDKQLEELSEKTKGNEELTKQIDELKAQNKETAKQYEDKLQAQAFEFKLDKELSNAKAKNPKAVKALLNIDDIKLDGDKLLGLEEQLNSLQENEGYLFDTGEPAGLRGREPVPPKGNTNTELTKEQFEKMSYSEKVSLYQENPDLYNQLK